MTPLLALLLVYSALLVALGWWMGRRVSTSSGFFVSDRSLSPLLIFGTFLAANIGATATVGATGLAYFYGPAAWWWSGSAGIGSLILAFVVGPRVWRLAREHHLLTVGDFLEFHYGPGVRTLVAVVLWLGSVQILTGQLKAAGQILSAAGNLSLPAGSLIATVVMTAYFISGGLRSAATINLVQLIVKLAGLALVVPAAVIAAHGLDAVLATHPHTGQWAASASPRAGWQALFLLGPAFFLSPGLLQKTYGARDERAVRVGIGWNGAALLLFPAIPILLGMSAHAILPPIRSNDEVLPQLLTHLAPAWIGGAALAAVFSAEMSTADAVLFMLSTSGAKDLYRGWYDPAADDRTLLRVARVAAVVGAVAGFALTFAYQSILDALAIFYSLLGAALFAPILGALFLPAGAAAAWWSIVCGVAVTLAATIATGAFGVSLGWASPALLGVLANAAAYLVVRSASPPGAARTHTTR